MNTQELLKLKDKITEGKERLNTLKGKLESANEQLKKSFDCDNIEQAREKLEEYEKNITELTEDIAKKVIALEEKYPQLFD